MEQNDAITIEQVHNGFVVKEMQYQREGFTAICDIRVFQSFAELTNFLEGHFEHRETALAVDGSMNKNDDS